MLRVPAEWENQRVVLLSFPHKNTDWNCSEDVNALTANLIPFIRIAQAISYRTPVYVICDDPKRISSMFCSTHNLTFINIETNDTWIRDYGYISVEEDEKIKLLDFKFDAWGGKFKSDLDNEVNVKLHKLGYMGTTELKSIELVLEGGAIDSDGEGYILTTSKCLCNTNRNSGLTKVEVENYFSKYFGTKKVLWLDYGYLAGDDTDSHVDTLARFADSSTIAYVKCEDEDDEHYEELHKMEEQLKEFKRKNREAYTLVALPMPSAKYSDEGERLPATYANFLITNGTLVYPTYSVKEDKIAHAIFEKLFPDREIIPVECSRLIEQGGSLHCSTMQITKDIC